MGTPSAPCVRTKKTPLTGAAIPEGAYADIGGGLRVHYHEAGEGHPVVFVHGSGPGASGYSNFKGCFPHFAANGFRALVPDTIGYGYSSKPEDAHYHLDYLVDGVRRFCDALGVDRCALVGNSLGGAMAIRFATTWPDRVSHLVLMAPGGLETRERYMEMEGIRTMMGAIFGPEGITPQSMRRIFGLQLYEPSQVSEATLDERLQIARTQPLAVFKTLRVPNLVDELTQLTCPVLVLWGKDDRFCPIEGAATIAERCPKARVVTLPQCGHWVMVEYPDLFHRECIDFLRGQETP